MLAGGGWIGFVLDRSQMEAWFKNTGSRVILGISAQTLISPALDW